MQLFSAGAIVFSNFFYFFYNGKVKKQALLFHSPAQTTAHSSELIFHIIKSRDQTSVLLSVITTLSIIHIKVPSISFYPDFLETHFIQILFKFILILSGHQDKIWIKSK